MRKWKAKMRNTFIAVKEQPQKLNKIVVKYELYIPEKKLNLLT